MRFAAAVALLVLGACKQIFPGSGPVQLDGAEALVRPGRQMEYCIDPSGQMTLDEVRHCKFERVRGTYPAFGITPHAVWVRFELAPDKRSPTDWYFELANAMPAAVAFFRVQADGSLREQIEYDSVPPRYRLIPHHYHVFPLAGVSEPETIYIRARSQAGLNMPVFLWNADSYAMRDMQRTLWFGLFFGIMFAMSLYNLFLFVSIRDRSYLYYVLYILFVTEFFALISGHAAYLVPDSMAASLPAVGPYTALSATIFALLFSRKFLLLSEKEPLLAKAVNAVISVHVAAIPLLPFVSVPTSAKMGNILPMAGIVVIAWSAVRLLRAGFKPARYFLIAWFFLLVGVTLFILQNLDLIPAGFTTQYGQFFGAALEAVLLSLALGYRINSLRASEQEARIHLHEEQARALEEQTAMAKSFERFVPAEFLEMLGKKSVRSIEQGDAVRREMAVLFLDIRGFTMMSERVGSEAVFRFLNEFHGGLEPLIQKHGGFIDKFIGDAVMALFLDPVESVRAATEMQQWVASRGSARIGIGVHFGELVLGTVGSPRRLETTVIGDTVNLASRIESINKQYGTDILVSDAVYRRIGDLEIPAREIDAIRVRGKTRPVVLYEIMAGLDPQALARREEHMSVFMAGLLSFRAGDFDTARANFTSFLELAGEDPVSRMYLARLESASKQAAWDGIWQAEA